DFSSTHSTIAFSGGARYSPQMSVTLPTSSGSVENRNDSARHGLMPYARHARATEVLLIFNCAANSREDQCVTPSFLGGGFKVAVTIARWSSVRGRPERGASARPARP